MILCTTQLTLLHVYTSPTQEKIMNLEAPVILFAKCKGSFCRSLRFFNTRGLKAYGLNALRIEYWNMESDQIQ